MAVRAARAAKAGTTTKAHRRTTRAPKPRQRRFRRLAVVYDIDGPRVRLGLLWFFCVLLALAGGFIGLTVLYAPTAAVAAMQTARAIRKAAISAAAPRPDRAVAGAGAALLVVAGAVTTGMLGVAVLVLVAAAVYVAWSDTSGRARRRSPLVDAAATVRAALFPGFAAACVIITARFELGSAVALLFVVAAYETGDYLIGSGAGNPYEGPVAGATAIVVVTFAITAGGVKPLAFPSSFVLGAVACVLCPAGQLLASLVLPAVTSPASALRRLDSLLVLAPVWALATGWLV
jgi:hypothetical protein